MLQYRLVISVQTYHPVQLSMYHTSSYLGEMEPVRTYSVETSIEDILQMPELPSEDVERILFSTVKTAQETYTVKGQNEMEHRGQPCASSTGCYSEGIQPSNNSYFHFDIIKTEDTEHEYAGMSSHVKQGVLNLNVKKYIDGEYMANTKKQPWWRIV